MVSRGDSAERGMIWSRVADFGLLGESRRGITAAVCTLTHGQPGGVCHSAGVQAAARSI